MTIETSKIKISTKTVLAFLTAVGAFAQTPFGQSLILHHAQLASAAAFVASALALLHNPVVEDALGLKTTTINQVGDISVTTIKESVPLDAASKP